MLKTQVWRFLVVGGLSTILNFSLFLTLYSYMGVQYMPASACGFIGGVIFGYCVNKSWTYEIQDGSDRYVLPYFGVYTVSLMIGLAFLNLQTNVLAVPPIPANVLTIGLTTCTNFLGTKFIVFKK